ncbi:galactosyltransferase-related protein [Rhizosphaericola mali]|uniref:Galactosyltransferase C-terminal domain-containing protein n=1 Tax=Rhizosphaericola mali TaxID=2545455 RepID=A0A5P2GB02_9BACT|nr:galactosyltransferase-related protein [Rhizosphaericola mali]QES88731.1 hypothetical protein E0W69_008730 [Rhizosphaericola mali]
MFYITVVPDDFYFIWQLELQLYNFQQLGVAAENIHVLIGYDCRRGLRDYFSILIEQQKDNALFFIYPDSRKSKNYLSSIRPHILKQHLTTYPYLEQVPFFYYDTDIIFRDLPDFENLVKGHYWYVSDTRNYLDSNYIKQLGGEELFTKMCDVVGIKKAVVENNDFNCGGAQYIIKNTTTTFWEKVENDCEALYSLMQLYNNHNAAGLYMSTKKRISEYRGIQAWCADMWAVLWNAWLFGYETKISKELEFCWAKDNIIQWHNKKILHYSGSFKKEEKQFFRKTNFVKYSPYYDSILKNIRKDNCSYPLVELIEKYRKNLDEKRINFSDVSILIPVRIDSTSRMENLLYVTNYLSKYFKTKILIAESDMQQKIDPELLSKDCLYTYICDDNPNLFHTRINNFLIRKSTSSFIIIHDTDIVIPIKQFIAAIDMLRAGKYDMVYPYDGSCVSVDSLSKEMFGKILEAELFELHVNKFIKGAKRSCGGAICIDREKYINAGMDNEKITSWGPEDLERLKRMKSLGYRVKKNEGNLYHLPHERFDNSYYKSSHDRIQFMKEYLKICRMRKKDLENYIETWNWAK